MRELRALGALHAASSCSPASCALGVSQTLVVRALAQAAGAAGDVGRRAAHGRVDAVARRGTPRSSPPGVTDADRSRPYPFCLASPLDNAITDAAGDRRRCSATARDWQVEWKWDGIRAQLIVARRPRLPVVARRGADHRSLPGSRRRRRRRSPTAPCSTARSWPSAAIGRCPSPRCSSASAASARWRGRRATCRSCSWPTTSSRTPAVDVRGDAADRSAGAPRGDRRRSCRARGAGSARRRARRRCCRSRTTPPAPPGSRRRRSACRPSSTRRDLGRAGRRARRVAPPRRRGPDAEAPRIRLRRRPQARRLVEVEDRSAHHRRGADLRAAGLGQARQPAHRLHLRRLARRRAGAGGEGLLGPDQRRDRRDGPLDPPAHGRALRPGAARRAGPRVRARLRGHRAVDAPRSGIAVRFPRMLRWRKDKPASEADSLATLEALMQSASADRMGG